MLKLSPATGCLLAALALAATDLAADTRILRCSKPDGGLLLTDAERCPTGSTLLSARVYDGSSAVGSVPSGNGVFSSPSTSGAPSQSKAQQRIAEAKVAACEDLDQRKQETDGLLSETYTRDTGGTGDEGQRLRDRLERIEADRCRLDCLPC